jgi:ketosteroid isomerase-like protein
MKMFENENSNLMPRLLSHQSISICLSAGIGSRLLLTEDDTKITGGGKVFDEQLETTPKMDNYSPVSTIRGLLDRQAAAICNRDISAATANYASDVLIFDVVGPLQHHSGNSSVRNRLQEWMGTFAKDAPVLFEITDPTIEASVDRGFSHSLNHVRASLGGGGMLDMYWRETLGWQKIDDEWKIVHAHSSVPFNPSTGMASTGLKP